MLDAMYVAATGMRSVETQLDVISNNLANVNTNSFKKARVSFDDLVYGAGAVQQSAAVLSSPPETNLTGAGAAVSSVNRDFASGELKATQNPLDLAIQGNGFIEVELENGEKAYTRLGALKINEDGRLALVNGFSLASNIAIPTDATSIQIAPDGRVNVAVPDRSEAVEVGQIELATFVNASGLQAHGEGLFLATDASGAPLYADPGTDGAGVLVQGYVEASNVNLVEELLDLVVAQRAYEVNSQVLRASDEIMKITNNLRS